MAGERDPDLGLVVDDVFAGDVVDDAAEGPGERERRGVFVGYRGAGVLTHRDPSGQAQRQRDRDWEFGLADGFAVDEQLGDAGCALAFEWFGLTGGFELEAEDVVAGWDLGVGGDVEVLLGDVVVGVAQPPVLDEEAEAAVDPALGDQDALGADVGDLDPGVDAVGPVEDPRGRVQATSWVPG